jgi:hypothetical protein
MVKLADSSILIWLIIFVMVSLAKGWSKLQESKESQSPESMTTLRLPCTQDAGYGGRNRGSLPAPRTARSSRQQYGVACRNRRLRYRRHPRRKVSADDIRHVVEQMGRKPPPLAPAPLPPPAPLVAKAEAIPPPSPTPPPPPAPSPPEASVPAQAWLADAPAPAYRSLPRKLPGNIMLMEVRSADRQNPFHPIPQHHHLLR